MEIVFRGMPRALRMFGALVVLCSAVTAQASEFYAAPNGSPTGSGSKTSPLDLTKALSSASPVRPGDTLWLTNGTYTGHFTSYLAGTNTQPITVRQIPNGHATIDGSLKVRGQWAHYWGFEVTNSNPDRTTTRPTGVEVLTSNVKLINLVIHEAGNGIGTFSDHTNVEIYGCIVYHNGWIGPTRGHGHAIYIQNRIGSKTVMDNVLFNGYSYGVHAYGEQGYTNNLRFEGNIIYNNAGTNFHVGGSSLPSQNITVTRNLIYNRTSTTNMRLGYSAKSNRGLTCARNILINGAAHIQNWADDVMFESNTIHSSGRLVTFNPNTLTQVPLYPTLQWKKNLYYSDGTTRPFVTDGLSSYTFPNWQATTGYDAYSKLTTRAVAPVLTVIARPNRYESGRGHLAIYNRSGDTTAQVDLQSILSVGMRYQIHPMDNIYGPPIATGTFNGKMITLPLNTSSAGTEFNAFLIRGTYELTLPGQRN